ncbi:MAG: chemotaxis protein [Firmicutes bacterium]|nr:chemotaxis protein [Bacillota bacterium]
MDRLIECFQTMAEFLVQTYELDCAYFTTDLVKYTFVRDRGLNLPGVKAGERLSEDGFAQKCIRDKQPVTGTLPKNLYGKRIKVWVRPVLEGGEVIGCCGVMVHKQHRVTQAFPDIAEPLANSFPDGALVNICDQERVLMRQASDKFDMPEVQVGTVLSDSGLARHAMRSHQVMVKDIDAEVYGIACRCISIPLYDPDDKYIVGTFDINLSRQMAVELRGMAVKLSANIQEIASVMEEVAASAGEVSINESRLADQVEEVALISSEINEVLDFIKNVADQTKMLGLNAAIEAARVGEHGRGFGVVAEEIRKLSDQSKETADRIRNLIRAIDNKIELIRQTSEGTLKQGQEQAAATEEVTASVMEMAQMAEKLAETAQLL